MEWSSSFPTHLRRRKASLRAGSCSRAIFSKGFSAAAEWASSGLQRLDRVVALKVLPDEVFYDVASREELKNETRKSLELTHSNIVRIHDFVEDEGSAAISMEYVDGATLSHLRLQAKNKVLEANVLGPWIREICEALHYAHQSAKLAHRDLKPANVMVNARDEVKITDFGIACSLRNSLSRVSIRQSSSGTLVYMSPEQMMGEAATPQDDIYALGATIYEMMTSKPPFYEGDIALQVCKVEASSMAERRLKLGIDGKEIPTAWEETIAKCLSKNPGKRPTSMMELAGTLGLLDQPVWKRQHLAKATSLLSGRAKDGFRALLKNRGARAAILAIGIVVAAPAVALLFSRAMNSRSAHSTAQRPFPPQSRPDALMPGSAPQLVESQQRTPIGVLPSLVSAREGVPTSIQDGRLEIITIPAGLHYRVFRGSLAELNASKPETLTPILEGATPAKLQNLERGAFTVVCNRKGWDDELREIQVGAETSHVEAAFPSGTLAIKSDPAGAEVLLDGEPIGVTPLALEAAPGDHEITATYGGKPEQDEKIMITEGKQTVLVIRFGGAPRKHTMRHRSPPRTGWQKLQATFKKVFDPSKKRSDDKH